MHATASLSSMVIVGFLPIEFFELISKAQSNRADDQRGLLRKEDLVLPEFLRLPSGSSELALSSPPPVKGFSKRAVTDHGWEGATQAEESYSDSPATSPASAQSPCSAYSPGSTHSPGSAHSTPGPPGTTQPGEKPTKPSCISTVQEGTTQAWRRLSPEMEAGAIQTVEDEQVADLTLMGEGDISSPNSTLLPPPPIPQDTPGPTRPGTSRF